MTDPFKVLGVSRTATDAEIKAAFRQLAKDCHPDTHPDDPEATKRFAEVSAAYDELKDGKAATYDQRNRQSQSAGFNWDAGRGHFDINIEELFKHHFRPRPQQPVRNADIQIAIDISLEEAYTGKTVKVAYELMKGHTEVDVKVPAGVQHGTSLRVQGAGQDSRSEVPPGDLYVVVLLRPHETFQRSGNDIFMSREIDVFTAILGGTINLTTLSGSSLAVTVPPFSDKGTHMRIAGRGMPVVGNESVTGDLHIILDVAIPKSLSDAQIDLIRQASEIS